MRFYVLSGGALSPVLTSSDGPCVRRNVRRVPDSSVFRLVRTASTSGRDGLVRKEAFAVSYADSAAKPPAHR